MLKPLIYALTLILLLHTSIAETQIFSGSVITDNDKVIDGSTFRFTYDEAGNKTFVQTPAQNMIVENGRCGSNNLYRVCINGASYYDRNITTYVTYYQLDVTVYRLAGSLSAISQSSSSNLLQGESANITITITNPSSVDISNIMYVENLTGFQVINVNGCSPDGDKISWSGSLQSGYNKVCTAWIVAQQEGIYNLAGTLNYFNGFETENKPTDTLTIKVLPDQLTIQQLVDDNVEFEQPFYFKVSLQNVNPTESIDLSVDINLPGNFMLLKKVEGFSQDVGALRSDSRMGAGSSFNYSLYLKANAESKIPITQVFNYKIKGLSYTIQNDTFIRAPEPRPIINLSTEYNELMPGEKFIVTAQIRNPSKVYELTNVKARLNAPYNNEIVQSVNKLLPNESYTIISSTLALPKDIVAYTLNLNLSIEYAFNGLTKSLN